MSAAGLGVGVEALGHGPGEEAEEEKAPAHGAMLAGLAEWKLKRERFSVANASNPSEILDFSAPPGYLPCS